MHITFMKFETSIYKIVKNHQQIFRKDPCTHAQYRKLQIGYLEFWKPNIKMFMHRENFATNFSANGAF